MGDEQQQLQVPRRSGGFRLGLATLAVVLLILWGFVFFALRTPGGHNFVTRRLNKAIRKPVTVGQVSLVPPLTLRLRDIRSEDFVTEQSGLAAAELRIRPAWGRIVVTAKRPELNLTFDGATWFPTNFAVLGDLPFHDLGTVSAACAGLRERMQVSVEGGQIFWHGQPDGLIASVRGLVFELQPVSVPGHATAYYHRLAAASAVEPAGRQTDQVEVEWLAVGDSRFVPVALGATLPTGDDAGFWGVVDETDRRD